MNKFVLFSMGKGRTFEELSENIEEARDYANSVHENRSYGVADLVIKVARSATSLHACDFEYWLKRYFALTGENREDYENKLKEINK